MQVSLNFLAQCWKRVGALATLKANAIILLIFFKMQCKEARSRSFNVVHFPKHKVTQGKDILQLMRILNSNKKHIKCLIYPMIFSVCLC